MGRAAALTLKIVAATARHAEMVVASTPWVVAEAAPAARKSAASAPLSVVAAVGALLAAVAETVYAEESLPETVAAAPTPPEVVAAAPLMATVTAASSALTDIAPAAPILPPCLRSQVSPLCCGHPEHQPLQHMESWGAVRPRAKTAPAVAPNCHQGSPSPMDHHHPMVLVGDLQPCHLSDLHNQTSSPLQLLRHVSPLPATPPATASFPATTPQTALSNPGSQPTFHHLLTADHLPGPHFPSLQHPVAAAVEQQSGCPSEWSPVVHTYHLPTTHPVMDALPAESKMGSSTDTAADGIGCSMSSHISDLFPMSNPVVASDGRPANKSSTPVDLPGRTTPDDGNVAASGLCRPAISSTNRDNTSSCTLVWSSIASRNMRFCSRKTLISSRIDVELEALLRVSKVWKSSSDRWTRTHLRWIKSSSIVRINDVVSIRHEKYKVPSGPRCCTMASTSCTGIHPNDNISWRDALFRSTGSVGDAMTQYDTKISDTRWRQSTRQNSNNSTHRQNWQLNQLSTKLILNTIYKNIYTTVISGQVSTPIVFGTWTGYFPKSTCTITNIAPTQKWQVELRIRFTNELSKSSSFCVFTRSFKSLDPIRPITGQQSPTRSQNSRLRLQRRAWLANQSDRRSAIATGLPV